MTFSGLLKKLFNLTVAVLININTLIAGLILSNSKLYRKQVDKLILFYNWHPSSKFLVIINTVGTFLIYTYAWGPIIMLLYFYILPLLIFFFNSFYFLIFKLINFNEMLEVVISMKLNLYLLVLPETILILWGIFLISAFVINYHKLKSTHSYISWYLTRCSLIVFFLVFIISAFITAQLFLYKSDCGPVYYYYNLFVYDFSVSLTKTIVIFFFIIGFYAAISNYQYSSRYFFEIPILFNFLLIFLIGVISSFDLIAVFFLTEGITFILVGLIAYSSKSENAVNSSMKYLIFGTAASALFGFGSALIYSIVGKTDFLSISNYVKKIFKNSEFSLNCVVNKGGANGHSIKQVIYKIDKEEISKNVIEGRTNDFVDNFQLLDINTQQKIILVGASLIIFSFFFKIAVVPFHQWAVDIYNSISWGLVYFIAIVVKIPFFFLLFRVVYYLFYSAMGQISVLLVVSGLLSLIFGAVAGLNFTNSLKEFFVYSSINQFGFIFLSISYPSQDGLNAAVFYYLIYLLSMSLVFLIFTHYLQPTYNKQITHFNELIALSNDKFLLFIFTFSIIVLSGLPPLVGFFSKLFLINFLVSNKSFILAAACLLFSAVSMFYYIKILFLIWINLTVKEEFAFFKNKPYEKNIGSGTSLVNGLKQSLLSSSNTTLIHNFITLLKLLLNWLNLIFLNLFEFIFSYKKNKLLIYVYIIHILILVFLLFKISLVWKMVVSFSKILSITLL